MGSTGDHYMVILGVIPKPLRALVLCQSAKICLKVKALLKTLFPHFGRLTKMGCLHGIRAKEKLFACATIGAFKAL